MFQSLRFGLRMMRKSPGFTVIAILTLALGVGANTAIFSVVDALLLRPLPLHDPSRLVVVTAADPGRPGAAAPYSLIAYEALRDHNRSFTGIAAFTAEGLTLTGTGDPEQLSAARVAPEFFDVLESDGPLPGRKPKHEVIRAFSPGITKGHRIRAAGEKGQGGGPRPAREAGPLAGG